MAALLTACGHRASQQEQDAEGTESAEFKVDSIGLEREDSMASVKVSIAWPTEGNDSLVKAIRRYICEELGVRPYQEGTPTTKQYDNGQEAVKATVEEVYKELQAMWQEVRDNGYNADMAYNNYMNIILLEDNDRYVTYLSNAEGYIGGAHGYASSKGRTFFKGSGRQFGYQLEYHPKTNTFDIKEQTLFKDPASPKLAALIKEGVCNYFKENCENPANDEELQAMLLGVDDVNRIPLPSVAPYFTKNGLAFVYQQYEIAPYSAGMVNFNIPYDKVRPLLTPEAAALLP